jgi:hypothetical protein
MRKIRLDAPSGVEAAGAKNNNGRVSAHSNAREQ